MTDAPTRNPAAAAAEGDTPEVHSHKSGRKSFDARDFWGMIKQTFVSWSEDHAMRLAAALSLYTILSLAPLLVIAVRVASIALSESKARGQIAAEVQDVVGPTGGRAIEDMVHNAAGDGSGTTALVISFVVLMFTASGVFAELKDALNTIWEVKPKPDWSWLDVIRGRLLSIAMVFAVIFLLLVSLVVSTLLLAASKRLGGEGWPSTLIDLAISMVVMTVLFAMILRYVPDVRLGWSDVWIGAAVTAGLFKLGQIALGLYFNYASPTSAYGAAGSFAAVLLWAYYSSMIFFLGAEFTQIYARRGGHVVHATQAAVPVTDEERAQQGLVTKDDVAGAAALMEAAEMVRTGKPRVVVRRLPACAWQWGVAAGGVAVGALVAAIGMRRNERTALRAVSLHGRLHRLEEQRGRTPRESLNR